VTQLKTANITQIGNITDHHIAYVNVLLSNITLGLCDYMPLPG